MKYHLNTAGGLRLGGWGGGAEDHCVGSGVAFIIFFLQLCILVSAATSFILQAESAACFQVETLCRTQEKPFIHCGPKCAEFI